MAISKSCEDHLGNRFEKTIDMCKFYGIKYSTFKRRIDRGYSLQDALTLDIQKRNPIITDHNGNTFNTQEEMCNHYGIDGTIFKQRLCAGKTIQEALETPIRPCIYDHEGNEFSSISEMCKYHNVSISAFENRQKNGYPLHVCLYQGTTTPCKDHLGNIYANKTEMCKYYGVNVRTFDLRKKKGLPLDICLGGVLPRFSPAKKCKDHLGNEFDSIANMCDFYNLAITTYYGRISSGWSLKDALETPAMSKEQGIHNKEAIDHLGNKFTTIKEMCTYYGITDELFCNRKRRGWSLEKILTEPLQDLSCYDHLGKRFNTITEMCRFYKIKQSAYLNRIKSGWSLKDALLIPTKESISCCDHLGNEFDSVSDMCKYYGLNRNTYNARVKNNWKLEDILTSPVNTNHTIECYDHLGNKFGSYKEMCEFYNISKSTYNSRIREGWTLAEALTIPRNMYIGEYRVAECLEKLHVTFYHDCQIKTIFKDLNINIDWDIFLDSLQRNLSIAGINWSRKKIEKLRPDFVLYTDNDNKIRGIIEFDGEQHQNFVEYFFKTIEEFYRRTNADFIKQSLWEYLNIPMLRIRHDQVDMIDDMVKDFIDNPQNYIHNHNTYLSEDEYWSILSEEKAKLELAFAS